MDYLLSLVNQPEKSLHTLNHYWMILSELLLDVNVTFINRGSLPSSSFRWTLTTFFWFNFLATLYIHFLATFYKPFNQVTFLLFECLYKVHHLKFSVRVVNKPLTDSIWIVLRVRADHISANDHELYSSKDIVRLHERKVKTSWESSWQVFHHSFDFLDIQIH